MPEAALALKQGVGRLIRSEEDRGVVAIAESRLSRAVAAREPPLTVTREQDESCRFLARHAPAVPAP